jgi:DNA-binding beta-propeller fold protein YncE
VTVSPDGKHVYVPGFDDDAVAVFSRDATTGALTFVEFKQDGVGGVDGLNGAVFVAVSPDGKCVYVTGFNDNAVAVFSSSAVQVVPVELASFTAAATASATVKLTWSTATEVENFGFNIYRSTAENGAYEKINAAIIPGAGNSTTPRQYAYTDANVTPGKTYWYKLQQVDFNGNFKFHGPIAVAITTAVAEAAAGAPAEFGLEQNYPNPFFGNGAFGNPATVISFQLSVGSEVKLAIYNTAGQLVRQVASGRFASGRHSVSWNGLDLHGQRAASGIYFYRIEAGQGFVQMKKMILTK